MDLHVERNRCGAGVPGRWLYSSVVFHSSRCFVRFFAKLESVGSKPAVRGVLERYWQQRESRLGSGNLAIVLVLLPS